MTQRSPDRRGRATTSADLPPVEEVVTGLWSLPVPLIHSPLGYVLVYAFETRGSGLVLVDAGWDAVDAVEALQIGLRQVGATLGDVEGLIVTHSHPDHYGMAGRIVEQSGAWLGMHPADAAQIGPQYEDPMGLMATTRRWLQRAGTPPAEIDAQREASLYMRDLVRVAHPDLHLEHHRRPPVPGRDLVILHTPGHTPGHLCIYDEGANVILTGDHVLPRISPNISAYRTTHNPLAEYLESLQQLRRYNGALVLPAHEWRFEGLTDRIDALLTHHEDRLAELARVASEGPSTAWELARGLSWSRDWDEPAFMRRAALGETYAHLLLLESRGLMTRSPGTPESWAMAQ